MVEYLIKLDRTRLDLLKFIVEEYERDIYDNDDGTLNKTKAVSDLFTIKEALAQAQETFFGEFDTYV